MFPLIRTVLRRDSSTPPPLPYHPDQGAASIRVNIQTQTPSAPEIGRGRADCPGCRLHLAALAALGGLRVLGLGFGVWGLEFRLEG